MRVITGSARGRRLKTLDGLEIRPTADKVKEAIFSIIQFDVEGSAVLDLFSGSGQLGIEALSRGAGSCVFVDSSRASLGITKENIETVGFSDRAVTANADAAAYLNTCKKTFDSAFLDPTYNERIIPKVLPLLAERMSARGIAVCEHEKGLELPGQAGELKKYRTYRYGKIEVTVYKCRLDEE